MKRGVLIFWAVIVILIVVGIGSSFLVKTAPGQYDKLAMCIKDQGVVFYGAFWCPHCQRTKGLFGSSEKYLPYVECSTPDGQGQTQVCKDHNVTSYPTWIRPDGAILNGEHTLDEWAAFSGCTLSGAPTTPTNPAGTILPGQNAGTSSTASPAAK